MILLKNYRRFINPSYSVRQMLVEHSHFNDSEKREHILKFLLRAPEQDAIPIVNYNDPVSSEENRKMELKAMGSGGRGGCLGGYIGSPANPETPIIRSFSAK